MWIFTLKVVRHCKISTKVETHILVPSYTAIGKDSFHSYTEVLKLGCQSESFGALLFRKGDRGKEQFISGLYSRASVSESVGDGSQMLAFFLKLLTLDFIVQTSRRTSAHSWLLSYRHFMHSARIKCKDR